MPFSLYGDLPEPSKEKESGNSTNKNPFSGLYSSLPAPESGDKSSNNSTTTPSTVQGSTGNNNSSSTPGQSNNTSKPTGWSAYGHFRPVMRKPTIQAKPKLNKPVIPAGATIVSTTTVNKESAVHDSPVITAPPSTSSSKDKRVATITSLPRPANNIPYFTANDDINGFKTSQQNKKKGKNKGKQQQQQARQPIVFDMNEDYDPHRPNDYEQYKEERKQLKEEMRRQKREQRRRSRSVSPYYSSDEDRRSRSRSPRNHGRAFAPPANLYGTSERRRSISRSPSPSHREPSASPPPRQANIDLNETADEAYMRRVRMSTQRTVPSTQQSRPTPMDEDDQDNRSMLGLGAGGGQDMAKKVMSKYGWQEGQGLGRSEDGIKEALKVQPIGRGSGVISNSLSNPATTQQPFVPAQQPRIQESTVVLLTNMVGPGEVDDMLQEETAEECAKYGEVERCLIFEVPNGQVPDDLAVRIFVKFKSVDAARSALNDLNGRYFGGRIVTAKFYDRVKFDRLDLAPSADELRM